MFRPGRNAKDQTHTPDDTADHTPQPAATPSGSAYGSGSGSAASQGAGGAGGGGAATPTEAYQQSVYTQTTSRAVTESESLARDIKEGTLTGFVGNGTTLTGEANFKGMLRVDGGLSGRVASADGTLIVSTNGRVDANVEVAIAQIYGTVNGDIVASKRIEMGRTAKVTGNIQTPTLAIEQGAIFEGSCRMSQAEKGTADAAAASASSASASTSGSSSSSTSGASKSGSSRPPYSSSSSSTDASSGSDVTDATDVTS